MKLVTAKETSKKWGISERRVELLCKQGRVKGAYRLGWMWVIPEDSQKPVDGRLKHIK